MRKRIHIALTEVYLRVKAAREEMLSAVQVAAGGGKWADNTLHAITDARVNTNKAVGLLEQANAIVTQLNENTQDSNTLIGGLLQVNELILQGWKWISMGALDCRDGATLAEDESLHSGTLIQRAQMKASEHLVSANKHLKGAADSCWGSLGDEETKKAMALDRAKLIGDFSMSRGTQHYNYVLQHCRTETVTFLCWCWVMQELIGICGAVSVSGTRAFVDTLLSGMQSLGAVERSGCMGLLALILKIQALERQFRMILCCPCKGAPSHTADKDLFRL